MASQPSTSFSEFFTPVSKSVYVSRPSATYTNNLGPATSSTTPPKSKELDVILLLSWSGASKTYIAKYIPGYRALFPNARVVLVTAEFSDLLYGSMPSRLRQYQSALEAIAAKPDTAVLVHLFSNGGAHNLWRMSRMYKQTTGSLLPVRALILDSSPGRISFDRSIAAYSQELRKLGLLHLPALCLAYVWISVIIVCYWVAPSVNYVNRTWVDLNKGDLIRREAGRCYIYLKEDEILWWRDVEGHADEAEARGWKVRRERFEGSRHVAHVRLDEGRYWRIVCEVWDGVRG